MGADMISMSLLLTKDKVAKLDKGENPYDTEAILADLDTLIRGEEDESTFYCLYELSPVSKSFDFDSIWKLHQKGEKGDELIEPLYASIKEVYRQMIKDVAESLLMDDVSQTNYSKEITQFITGGLSWGGSPTETYELWSTLFGESDYSPYPDWLYEKLSASVGDE